MKYVSAHGMPTNEEILGFIQSAWVGVFTTHHKDVAIRAKRQISDQIRRKSFSPDAKTGRGNTTRERKRKSDQEEEEKTRSAPPEHEEAAQPPPTNDADKGSLSPGGARAFASVFEKAIAIQEERTKALESHVKALEEELRAEVERRTRAETLLEIRSNFSFPIKSGGENSLFYSR